MPKECQLVEKRINYPQFVLFHWRIDTYTFKPNCLFIIDKLNGCQ